jgi:hypothetical protein
MRFSDAVDFCSSVLGFANRSNDPALGDHDAKPLNLFVIEDDEISGLVMELRVRNCWHTDVKSSDGEARVKIAISGIPLG